MPRRPIESGLGSPAQRGSGKSSGLVCFAKPKSFPARMGAECVSVSPLRAIGLVESLLADIWLICGSVHPPLFASTSVFLIAIASIYFAEYCPFFSISSFLSGIRSEQKRLRWSQTETVTRKKRVTVFYFIILHSEFRIKFTPRRGERAYTQYFLQSSYP